ncbi:vacuolar protein sorting-associated protein 13B [Elysia marginata]|uniref:Vacuolar protein sorting-associated protein 13B n=1 Tax=Elysia marginata TaxID=1093978 RepID=A0AAV4EFH3_9GAST|nr:vacuolar protein sorting-associated protein 13B [Elysia marginata]
MGYLDKYVKLRQEDFQLSLWGGDAVLNNLDLRLDELEKVVQLPVMFQSGHIHELRLHVPWTKLGSEPVVITINTVECIVKVRDTAYEAGSSGKSASPPARSQQRPKTKRRAQPTEDLPPGYLQSIVNRIVNNVTFIMNNLILKFVEDDIVLSVNIKSAECYSVDKEWNRAFVDLSPHDLALRKIINFADLTVCLDKTNASGHIESYQEPMAYRCAVTCRFHMEYDSVTAKFPRASRFNLYCDTLNLTLTDTQLPMFVRLVQLCIAMYYGLLDIPAPPSPRSSSVDPAAVIVGDSGEQAESSEKSRDSSDLPHKKMVFHPFLKFDIEGAGTEVLLQGLEFFSVQCGFTAFKLSACGGDDEKIDRSNILLSGGQLLDQKIGLDYLSNSLFDDMSWENRGQRSQHIVDGDQHRQVFTEQYALQRFGAFWLDQLYTMDKPEKFWARQYVIVNPVFIPAGSNSSETNGSEPVFMKEYSTLRFLLGNTHLQFTSTFYHRVAKLLACAANHHYLPYGSGKTDPQGSQEERPKPSEEQIQSLEEFIPTNIMHFMLINPTVTLVTAEHASCDVTKKNFKAREKKKRESSGKAASQQKQQSTSSSSLTPSPSSSLPALTLTASRFDLQVTRPMYPGRLVKMVTSIAGPSSNLLHHCHSHTQIKLFSLQGGLQRCELDRSVSHTLTLLPPCSFALYSRSLQLPKLWTNSSLSLNEWMYEVPNLSVNVSKASLLMVSRVLASWLSPSAPYSIYAKGTRSAGGTTHHQQLVSMDSLLDDLFPVSGESTHQTFPMLEVGLCGLEFKSCKSKLVNAFSGGLSSLHVLLYTPGIGGRMSAIPILYGPNDTSTISETKFFTRSTMEPSSVRSDCITATIQIPKHTSASEAQALTLVDCQGLCMWLDPSLISWFHYCPQPRPGHNSSADQPSVTLDLSLAQMTSPLNAVSQASVHSTSSPSHQGGHSRQQMSTSHRQVPTSPRHASTGAGGDGDKPETKRPDDLGHCLAQWFPLIRLLHLQVDIKPCAIFLPKTSIPTVEASPDILTLVHQARQQGRLSDTLVICLPGVAVSSTMTKPLSVVQDLPVTSIHGSLIGEKLPWTVKITNTSMYALLSGTTEPCHLLHPLDILSTVAVTCKYNPPTSETISSLALCLHVDVGSPQFELTAAQLQLCSTVASMVNSITGNALSLADECSKYFASPSASSDNSDTKKYSPSEPLVQSQPITSSNQGQSTMSARIRERTESVGEATETNPTTDISEDFSHEGSPLHENLIDETGASGQGIKLSLWLQLMVPSATANVYTQCPFSGKEHGLSLSLDHLDVSLDSQHIYTKVKLSLGSIGVQHSSKGESDIWSWTDAEGIVMSCRRQLPRHLSTVTTRLWRMDSHVGHHGPVFPQHHIGGASSSTPGSTTLRNNNSSGSKKNSSTAISVTFTMALCKNVKRRLRKANVELPIVSEMDSCEMSGFPAANAGASHNDEHSGTPDRDTAADTRLDNLELYFHRYLSEICIKTEPLDFVFKPELMTLIAGLTTGNAPPVSSSYASSYQDKSKVNNLMKSPGFERTGGRPKVKKGTAHDTSSAFPNFPLIYADLGVIRVFLPKSHNAYLEDTTTEQAKECSASSVGTSDLSSSTVVDIEEDAAPQHAQGGTAHTGKPPESPLCGPESEVCSTLHHTMLVVQVNGCVVQPHADNPLPRPSQEKRETKLIPIASPFDLCVVVAPPITYLKKNLASGESAVPILVCGLTSEMNVTSDLDLYVSSNQLKLLAEMANQFGRAASAHTKARRISRATVKIQPTQKLQTENESLGTPRTQDYGETHKGNSGLEGQGAALLGVDSGVESDLSALTPDHHRVTPAAAGGTGNDNFAKNTNQKGSGPGALTAERDKQQEQFGSHKSSAGDDGGGMFSSAPPLDILLTAGRISCTVYTHKILEEDFTIQMPFFGDHRVSPSPPTPEKTQTLNRSHTGGSVKDNLVFLLNKKSVMPRETSDEGVDKEDDEDEGVEEEMLDEGFTSFNFMKPQPEDNAGKKVIAAGSVSVVPFVYVFITQPHCILSNHGNNNSRNCSINQQQCAGDTGSLGAVAVDSSSKRERKLEVSCYDVLVKGASDRHISAVDEYHVIPVCADFNVHWLETRPGEPDPHTGIPPSLLTARLVQNAHMPGVIKLSLDRPVRLKVSQLAVEQISSFCGDLVSVFTHAAGSGSREKLERATDGLSPEDEMGKGNQADVFSLAERLEISTSQLVLDLDLDSSTDSGGSAESTGGPFSTVLVLSLQALSAQLEIVDVLSGQSSCYTITVKMFIVPGENELNL